MTPADWQALVEQFLSGEIDAESFHEDFLEGWQAARDDKIKIPRSVETLPEAVEGFVADDADTSAELRDAAEAALEKLKAIAD